MRRLEIEKLNTKARRNLKKEDLQNLYTEEELDILLGRKAKPSDEWYGQLELLKQAAKDASPRQRRRWSPEEDKFLYDTYLYLPDATIGLALNIPQWEVSKHRIALKLEKRPEAEKGVVVVWHHRTDFEKDLQEQQLLKVRGEDVHPLLR